MDINFWVKKWNPNDKEKAHRYRFDFMEDNIKKWKTDHITKQMIELMPWGICVFDFITPSGYQEDYYGNAIKDLADFQQWHREREEFVDYLYEKYKR